MTNFSKFASLALAAAALAGCDQDVATEPTTVQLAIVAGAAHGGLPFTPTLTQEVTTQPVFFGDEDGTGMALITVNLGQSEVCWDVTVSDILLPATASHIHRAPAGVRGPIVIPISAPDASARAVGCASGIDRELLREIITTPSEFYVNVHTSEFPFGAVRGQLAN